jgi:hypothetical protein
MYNVSPPVLVALTGLALVGALAGCDPQDAHERERRRSDGGSIRDAGGEPKPGRYGRWPDPLANLPRGPAQTAAVCARPGDDPVRDVFCAEPAPTFTSLVELQTALRIDSMFGFNKGLAVAGHSTALATRSVSAINPRVIVLRLEYVEGRMEPIALAFVRGEQFSELVVRDRSDGQFRFYLVGFRQACNDSADGCLPGDLLTPAIEQDWTELTLYDEPALTNTVLDCATCHQPDGPGTPKLIRMQELEPPWTHWFFASTQGGRALLADYDAAKGDEPLAGMTAEQINAAHPGNLSMLSMSSGSPRQPNEFLTQAIEDEVRASAAAAGVAQPEDNSVPGDSPTWREAYQRYERGEAIPVPYHDVKVTDPGKLARMTAAYRAYRAGELERAELPDIRDVFPDDERRLAAMGVMTTPGLDGKGVLVQACSQCHNPRLDQSLTRARFRADLIDMNRAARDLAIDRMQLPDDDPLKMPPPLLKQLSAEALERALEALREGQ